MANQELRYPESVPSFESRFDDPSLMMSLSQPSTLQINLGRLCNLACKHCHVSAGPNRTEIMRDDVMDACLQLMREQSFQTIDITGGAPEMHPKFRSFLKETAGLAEHIIVRSNLVILLEEGYQDLPELFRKLKVNIVCSLPHYIESATDRVRGDQVFSRSIRVLQELNDLGYGKDDALVLDMVFNPGGAYLPPSQVALEAEYKEQLYRQFGIVFNKLFVITNNPIGRFGAFLERSGNLDDYMEALNDAFNPDTLCNMMCRDQISVAWDGDLYDCDFNQAADLKLIKEQSVFDLLGHSLERRAIRFGKHCYACTAGQGSSCGGATQA